MTPRQRRIRYLIERERARRERIYRAEVAKAIERQQAEAARLYAGALEWAALTDRERGARMLKLTLEEYDAIVR